MSKKQLPENLEWLENEFCSNFDGVINKEVAGLLTAQKHWAGYAAWEWYGHVWYDGQFNVEVMRHQDHVDTISAPTPEELKELVCSKWGEE